MLHKKILAGVFAFFLSTLSTTSHAYGELENVTLSIFVFPCGAPQAYIEEDVRHPRGIDVDIIYELQRRLLFTIKDNRIYPLERNLALNRLRDGTADLVGGGISYTVDRSEWLDFSPIFYSSSLAVLYNSKKNTFRSISDIKGKRIGVDKGSTSELYAESNGAIPVYIDSLMMSYFDVAYDRLDGLIFDRPPMADFAKKLPDLNLAVNTEEFGQDECEFAFALSKDSPYTAIISKTIEEMMMDGTIQAILEKWGAQ